MDLFIALIIVAVISFLLGMCVILIKYYVSNRKTKTYSFKNPSKYIPETSADLYTNKPSNVDGSKATDKFNK